VEYVEISLGRRPSFSGNPSSFSGRLAYVPDIEEAAAMAVRMHQYGDRRFRQV
jgi:hypothetical protein